MAEIDEASEVRRAGLPPAAENEEQINARTSSLPNQAESEAARRRRDRQLSMSERLERVHQLCAQMTQMTPVHRRRD